ncbi:MAG: hypothetical protein KDC05_14170, partial [Bacteroidales bacterium]|nr:hypothetical protein [Bacteroidales bacterium]
NLPAGIRYNKIFLPPYVWYYDLQPHPTFQPHVYDALFEILRTLKQDHAIVKHNLNVQLWLFHPRFIQSMVIVSTKEKSEDQQKKIEATQTEQPPPPIIHKRSKGYTIKKGNHVGIRQLPTTNNNIQWEPIPLGDIWVIE